MGQHVGDPLPQRRDREASHLGAPFPHAAGRLHEPCRFVRNGHGHTLKKAGYSNYGTGKADVAAPGGAGTTGDCRTTILSTLPGGSYGCIQGTSMASPHAAGVAALIVSQFGSLGSDGDVRLSPTRVESLLQSTAIDIGLPGYDECFGNGRIDALRAVTGETSTAYDASAPFCPEYDE